MNTKPVQPHGGPVPERVPVKMHDPAKRAEMLREVRASARKPLWFLLGCFVTVVGGLIAWQLGPGRTPTCADLETRKAHDVAGLLQRTAQNEEVIQILDGAECRNAQGREFWKLMVQHSNADFDLSYRLTGLAAVETLAPYGDLSDGKRDWPAAAWTFTGPRAGDLARLVQGERSVLATFNAHYWNSYPDNGVIVIWSDSSRAQWLTFEEAAEDWSITPEEWADPAGKLFGKKAPFQHTYE